MAVRQSALESMNELLKDLDKNWEYKDGFVETDLRINELVAIGEPALRQLKVYLQSGRGQSRAAAYILLAKFGEPGKNILRTVLAEDSPDSWPAIIALEGIGKPAFDVLVYALDVKEDSVNERAASILGQLGEPALEVLANRALEHPNRKQRIYAIHGLINIGQPAQQVIMALMENPDMGLRWEAMQALFLIGINEPTAPALARMLEDVDGSISRGVISSLEHLKDKVDLEQLSKAIIDELVIRVSGRPSEHFNSEVVSQAFEMIIALSPRLRSQVLGGLCDIAYQNESEMRTRAVLVARKLAYDEFASMIKARAPDNPTAAQAIMHLLGGDEALAYLSEQQGRTLQDYRTPLLDLDKSAQQRWDEKTRWTNRAFIINMVLSIGVFVVGTITVIWGLVLISQSADAVQKIGGIIVSALPATAAAFSGRFWKDPVEHIQKFDSQQSRLQAAFIGYMNRVAQVRLVFEQKFAAGITLDELRQFQEMMKEASADLDASTQEPRSF